MRFDARVHQRLRVARLVALVVPEAAEADHVEHHVLVELLPVVERDAQGPVGRLGVVAVDVEDGELRHARHVGRVDGRAPRLRRRGEADLVVDDDVDGAARAVAFQLGELQGLHHDALPGEGRVAVEQDGERAVNDLLARLALKLPRVLLGAHHALDHGVNEFEVARVGRDGDAHILAGRGLALALRALRYLTSPSSAGKSGGLSLRRR